MRKTVIATGKPPGYWEAYFNDLRNEASAEMLNASSKVLSDAWVLIAEGWQELAEYHREEGT